jgi:excisionase family DNA binding protein
MEPVLLRIPEAAQLLNVSKWTVYRWIEEGRLQATKIGQGSLRVFRNSLTGLVDGARTGRALPNVSSRHSSLGRKSAGVGNRTRRK